MTRLLLQSMFSLAACAVLMLMPARSRAAEAEGQMRVYFGTYTGKASKGIYTSMLDLKTGTLSTPELAAETVNPSFLAIAPSGKFLYAVGEVNDIGGKKGGAVSTFAIGTDGKLTALNQQSSAGQGPAHISLDADGKHAFVANYGSGSVACLPIDADGKLREATSTIQHGGSSVDPKRQKGPHAHSIFPDPTGKFVMSADLGLDKILVYKFDAAGGKLTPNDPPAGVVKPGSGPRHLAFHPDGKFAFVINEMGNTVTSFRYDGTAGTLKELQTLPTIPAGAEKGNSTAEIVVHPSGKFVYGSNRGHDSIVCYSFDAGSGKLTLVGNTPAGGKTPRNFNIDPTGTFLLAAHQSSGTVSVFRIDAATGSLSPVGQPTAVGSPVCVKFLKP